MYTSVSETTFSWVVPSSLNALITTLVSWKLQSLLGDGCIFQVWVFNVVSMLKLHKAWVEISSKLLSTQLSLIYMDMVHNPFFFLILVHNPFIPLLFTIVLLFFCRNLLHLICQINKMLSSEPQAPVYFSYLWLACPIVRLASYIYPHNLSNSSFSSLFPAGLPRFFFN